MLLKNRIFLDRLEGVGSHQRRGRGRASAGRARACARRGVAYDVRKAHPYLKYDEVDFDVPVGTRGDNLDRFLVPPRRRFARARASSSSALERMPDEGAVNFDDPRVILPDKTAVYTTIEGTIQHFKLDHGGREGPRRARSTRTPKAATASSASTSSPTAAARRTACASARRASRSRAVSSKLIDGPMLSDIVPTFGSLNMIGGECDH